MNARRTTDESSEAIAPWAGMMPLPNWGIDHLSGAPAPVELTDQLMRHVARGRVGVLGKLLERHVANSGKLISRAVTRRRLVIRVDGRIGGGVQRGAVLIRTNAARLHQRLDLLDLILGELAALAVNPTGQQRVALARQLLVHRLTLTPGAVVFLLLAESVEPVLDVHVGKRLRVRAVRFDLFDHAGNHATTFFAVCQLVQQIAQLGSRGEIKPTWRALRLGHRSPQIGLPRCAEGPPRSSDGEPMRMRRPLGLVNFSAELNPPSAVYSGGLRKIPCSMSRRPDFLGPGLLGRK